ncbi:MAG: P-II family nitrogen regulator [Nitrospinales bacterium]
MAEIILMKLIVCNIRYERLEEIREKLFELGVPGLTVSEVKGIGKPMHQLKSEASPEPVQIPQFHPRIEMRLVLEDEAVEEVVETIVSTVRTGNLGDGKIFVLPVEEAIRIRTGEKGTQALY